MTILKIGESSAEKDIRVIWLSLESCDEEVVVVAKTDDGDRQTLAHIRPKGQILLPALYGVIAKSLGVEQGESLTQV